MKRLYFVLRMAVFAALIALCLTGQTKWSRFYCATGRTARATPP
jgi:hypothetical protein